MTRAARWMRVLGGTLLVLVALVGEGGLAGAAPAQAPTESTSDWVQISSGFYHTCGIRNTGRLYCWGQDNRSQLGNGGANTNVATPVEVSGGATDWKSVSAGGDHTCAIKTNGTLWCFGGDDAGQLGNGATTADQSVPVQVGAATDWKSVSAGLAFTTCGRRANKRIYCWGRDGDGQVGNGSPNSNVNVPTEVAGNHADWTMVSTGGDHACGLRQGKVYCWGNDLDGQVGDGGGPGNPDRSSPVLIAGGFRDWTSVSAGLTHTCARRATGRIYCFGSDIKGGIGDGGATNVNRYAPVEVKGHRTDWAAVFAGGYVSCARRNSGQLFCWGDDFYGQNGTGSVAGAFQRAAPAQVAGAAIDWRTATIGNLHVCARKSTSRIFCWGYGYFGQRGDGVSGNNNPQPNPTEVAT